MFITFLLLNFLNLNFSLIWECTDGCNEPTIEYNSIYCQNAGTKDSTNIESINYYNMMPTGNQQKYFTSVFKFYDLYSSHYHTNGLIIGQISRGLTDITNTWNTPYKNTMIRVEILTFFENSDLMVKSTYYTHNDNNIIGSDTIKVETNMYDFVRYAKFTAHIGDTYSSSGRIYI